MQHINLGKHFFKSQWQRYGDVLPETLSLPIELTDKRKCGSWSGWKVHTDEFRAFAENIGLRIAVRWEENTYTHQGTITMDCVDEQGLYVGTYKTTVEFRLLKRQT